MGSEQGGKPQGTPQAASPEQVKVQRRQGTPWRSNTLKSPWDRTQLAPSPLDATADSNSSQVRRRPLGAKDRSDTALPSDTSICQGSLSVVPAHPGSALFPAPSLMGPNAQSSRKALPDLAKPSTALPRVQEDSRVGPHPAGEPGDFICVLHVT